MSPKGTSPSSVEKEEGEGEKVLLMRKSYNDVMVFALWGRVCQDYCMPESLAEEPLKTHYEHFPPLSAQGNEYC